MDGPKEMLLASRLQGLDQIYIIFSDVMFEWFLDAVGLPQICIPASVEAVVVDQNVLLAVVLGVLVVELDADEPDVAECRPGHPDVIGVGAEHSRHSGLRELAVGYQNPMVYDVCRQ